MKWILKKRHILSCISILDTILKSNFRIKKGNKMAKLVVSPSAMRAPSITSVRPYGSTVLVDLLNPDEILGTTLYIKDDTKAGAPQGYVLAFGPKLDMKDMGLKVGDRVLLQGTFVPVPDFGDAKRQKGIVELHNIKAVFEESDG
jgi:co-chaperonin GroES (HSP10)